MHGQYNVKINIVSADYLLVTSHKKTQQYEPHYAKILVNTSTYYFSTQYNQFAFIMDTTTCFVRQVVYFHI
jgi:hypothetical protein